MFDVRICSMYMVFAKMWSKTWFREHTHCRAVGRSENPGDQYYLVGIICLSPWLILILVEIGLTDLPKYGGTMTPPAPRSWQAWTAYIKLYKKNSCLVYVYAESICLLSMHVIRISSEPWTKQNSIKYSKKEITFCSVWVN